MTYPIVLPALCPDHGEPKNRATCSGCNSAYMRGYLRRRSNEQPEWAIWQRAKKRASRLGLAFNLPLSEVVLPDRCPVMGTPLVVGGGRSPHSPSLDRIDPRFGYITGNCRVICDHANRLKGNLSLQVLKERATRGKPALRIDYANVVQYVEREKLLGRVWQKASTAGCDGSAWTEIAKFLDDRFRRGRLA